MFCLTGSFGIQFLSVRDYVIGLYWDFYSGPNTVILLKLRKLEKTHPTHQLFARTLFQVVCIWIGELQGVAALQRQPITVSSRYYQALSFKGGAPETPNFRSPMYSVSYHVMQSPGIWNTNPHSVGKVCWDSPHP